MEGSTSLQMRVHPTAIIEEGAQLGPGVEIGPFCHIGPLVHLGEGCRLHSHISVHGDTHLGPHCEVWPFASLGAIAQDKKLDDDSPVGRLRIGAHNKLREYVTVSSGTPTGGGTTSIGDHNMLLINSHVGHDVTLGNNVIMTNGAMLAGHTTIEDRAVLGALVGLHQFVRVGSLAMCGGGAMIAKDVPPYALVHGDRARIRGVNVIGMRRSGISHDDLGIVKRAFRGLFWRTGSLHQRVENVRIALGDHPMVAEILNFMEGTKRGVLMARGRTDLDEERNAGSRSE